jgi:hypothetical protein
MVCPTLRSDRCSSRKKCFNIEWENAGCPDTLQVTNCTHEQHSLKYASLIILSALSCGFSLTFENGNYVSYLQNYCTDCILPIQTDPNVAAEMLALLLRIPVVPGTNLGPETGYPDRFFVYFLSPSKLMLGYYLKVGHDRFLLHPFQLIIHCHPLI